MGILYNYERPFVMALKKALVKRVRGGITIDIDDENLDISIDFNGKRFFRRIENFVKYIHTDGNVDVIVDSFCDEYRKWLIRDIDRNYFKKAEEVAINDEKEFHKKMSNNKKGYRRYGA